MKRKALSSALLLILAFALLSGCASAPQPGETADGADWMEGRRFETGASEEEINNWAAEMRTAAER